MKPRQCRTLIEVKGLIVAVARRSVSAGKGEFFFCTMVSELSRANSAALHLSVHAGLETVCQPVCECKTMNMSAKAKDRTRRTEHEKIRCSPGFPASKGKRVMSA